MTFKIFLTKDRFRSSNILLNEVFDKKLDPISAFTHSNLSWLCSKRLNLIKNIRTFNSDLKYIKNVRAAYHCKYCLCDQFIPINNQGYQLSKISCGTKTLNKNA
ncbi:hypothetical protein NQ317_001061 [Molorchus minor]|uniref:Uncharacterized protein n=1 Tax=Molorchus minor TaxID=1323400 RepID=A0ABQ9JQJ9_9CUCU|nr:hypothetical protein NQ317_001061 [Molorchus minor]